MLLDVFLRDDVASVKDLRPLKLSADGEKDGNIQTFTWLITLEQLRLPSVCVGLGVFQ